MLARPSRPKPPRTIPAPMRGWYISENLAANQPMGAQHLENWFPTEQGCRVRRGATRIATIGGQAVSMFSHEAGGVSKLFASTATGIYDATAPADVDTAEDPVVAQQNGGYWHAAQMSTAGGQFTVAVNNSTDDWPQLYDGTNFTPITGVQVHELPYDALTGAFTRGLVVTGAPSGATATIVGTRETTSTTGVLYVTGITGTFADNDALTDTSTGSATEDGVTSTAASGTGMTFDPVASHSPKDLVYVTSHKSRLWFIEGSSQSIWYLPVKVFTGELNELTLSGVFRTGAYLLFAATWSADSGDGMDDRLVIVNEAGEVAVYEGTDPSSVSTWGLVGRYDIGRPLGPKCWTRAGGDIIIGTDQGAMALSKVVMGNPNALTAGAISYPIEKDWRTFAEARQSLNWEMAQSRRKNWAICTQPTTVTGETKRVYAVNLKTAAWALWTGWDALCLGERDGEVYCGTEAGRILLLDDGSQDDGSSYLCRLATHFDHLGQISALKRIQMVRATLRSNARITPKLTVSKDYKLDWPAAPNAGQVGTGDTYGTGVWGTATWASNEQIVVETRWVNVLRQTRVASVMAQLAVDGGSEPDIELASFDVLYDMGHSVA